MGPRPFGRGRMVKHMTGILAVDVLQWGRDLSAAEGRRGDVRWSYQQGFNGAATFRPRKARNPRGRRPRPIRLQWGRDLSAAEGVPQVAGRLDVRRKLQWGRDLSAAEGFPGGGGRPVHVRLQWGRDLSAAEGTADMSDAPDVKCFNGAATFRPRKDNPPFPRGAMNGSFNGAATFRPRKEVMRATELKEARQLQWGRDLSAAEGRQGKVGPD